MKSSIIIISVIFCISLVLFVKCSSETFETQAATIGKPTASPEFKGKTQVERGAYLVNSIGCDDCHSPKKMGPQGPEVDQELRLSGHPAGESLPQIKDPSILRNYALFNFSSTATIGPWGTSFAANLTPDESGIGTWTEAQFLKSIKEGKLKGMENTRPLLPPMPWLTYKHLDDDDLKAIFAYLKTLRPVRNVVPAPIPPAG